MKIDFLKPVEPAGSIKATIHKNGKMGFSKSASKKFGLDEGRFMQVGINSENKNDENLYVVVKKFDDGESLKVLKAGQYHYLNSKALFDMLKIDYKHKKIIYDVEDFEYNGVVLYKFVKRELDRDSVGKNKNNDTSKSSNPDESEESRLNEERNY